MWIAIFVRIHCQAARYIFGSLILMVVSNLFGDRPTTTIH